MNHGRVLRGLLGLGLALSIGQAARADDPRMPQVWLNAGLQSYHFNRNKHYREQNWGFGAEALLAPDHAVMAGTYLNSENARSHYIGYEWRPWHWRLGGADVSAGVAATLIDGYPSVRDRGWFVAPVPLLALEGRTLGANLAFLPNAHHGSALALQLKLKFWN